VVDISPLKALPGLTKLRCDSNVGGKSKLSDLSALAGMRLKIFYCNATAVSDLSPLRGMPLTVLRCNSTPVSDLTPLVECRSLESISLHDSKVTPSGVAALQKALPNCKIEWDDPAKTLLPQGEGGRKPDEGGAVSSQGKAPHPNHLPAGEGVKPKTPEPAAAGTK